MLELFIHRMETGIIILIRWNLLFCHCFLLHFLLVMLQGFWSLIKLAQIIHLHYLFKKSSAKIQQFTRQIITIELPQQKAETNTLYLFAAQHT